MSRTHYSTLLYSFDTLEKEYRFLRFVIVCLATNFYFASTMDLHLMLMSRSMGSLH